MHDYYEGVPQERVARLRAFRSTHPCQEIDVAGVRWEYISCGSGPETLLLLPGGMRAAESAFPYVEMFEDAYRVIVPTYPPLRTMDGITDGLVALLDAGHVPGAYVLGQSYGGLVAQVFLRRFPERASKLVLSSTGPLAPWESGGAALMALAWLMPLAPERFVMSTYKRALLPVISASEPERAFWAAYLDELVERRLTKRDVLSHFWTLQHAVKKHAYPKGQASPWLGDVLIIGSDNDSSSTERDQARMAEIYPRTRVQVIPGAGHTVALSAPARYATAVKGFLQAQA